MSKLKVSFTALLTLILVSMFAAFAAAEDFVPTSTNPGPGINVGDYNNKGEKATHKTHGNFQNNTNSCANCHSTHNGETETLLKFSTTEFEMCLSCHDGTMGFYNVLGQGAGAGTFNTTHDSNSMHNVKSALGSVTIGSAPGASLENKENSDELNCSSCHNPHGSVNDRLLKESVLNGELYAIGSDKLPLAKGTKAISLELAQDPAFAALNAVTGDTGLKITKSNGPADNSSKTNYSNFCSTCHDEYLMKSGTARTSDGHYSHTTNSTSAGRNCASCHFAHGTDVTLMKDTQGKTVADYVTEGWSQEQAEGYMKEVSGDSNLKKYTNMAVCWTCHQTSHALDTQQPAAEYLTPIADRYGNLVPTFKGKPGIK